jgi:hypothetical protein
MKQDSTDGARARRGAGDEPQRKRGDDLKKPEVLQARDPSLPPGTLKRIGGSASDDWNNRIANETINTLWLKNSDEETRHRQMTAAVDGLIGINPRDELEGMMAAQLIASHSAAMECYRRAMIGEQTFQGRSENLNQANKLSRSFATLLDALNRHRGKGQQKVTVEHVHVHSGGQAIVGAVGPGGGIASKDEEQRHAKQIAHAPEPPLRSADAAREPMSVASDGERPLPDARQTQHRPENRTGEGQDLSLAHDSRRPSIDS